MKQKILLVLGCLSAWSAIGLMVGGMETGEEREAGNSGCIYRSYAAFLNPGYLAGCELFRRRFAYEPNGIHIDVKGENCKKYGGSYCDTTPSPSPSPVKNGKN